MKETEKQKSIQKELKKTNILPQRETKNTRRKKRKERNE